MGRAKFAIMLMISLAVLIGENQGLAGDKAEPSESGKSRAELFEELEQKSMELTEMMLPHDYPGAGTHAWDMPESFLVTSDTQEGSRLLQALETGRTPSVASEPDVKTDLPAAPAVAKPVT